MPSLNIDRRRFLGAMGVLGAASLAGGVVDAYAALMYGRQ